MNQVETLIEDEMLILDKYRRAKSAKHATLEIHIQDGRLVHINLTEKFRPEDERRLRERKVAVDL